MRALEGTAPEGAAERSHMVEYLGVTGKPTGLSGVPQRHLTATWDSIFRGDTRETPG